MSDPHPYVDADPQAPADKATRDDKNAAEHLSAQWVIDRLMAIASADISALIELDAYGFPTVNLELLTPELKAAMQEINTSSYKGN